MGTLQSDCMQLQCILQISLVILSGNSHKHFQIIPCSTTFTPNRQSTLNSTHLIGLFVLLSSRYGPGVFDFIIMLEILL